MCCSQRKQAHPGSEQSCLLRLEARGLQAARNVPPSFLYCSHHELCLSPIAKVQGVGMPSAATAQFSTSSEEHVLSIIIELITIE